MVRDNDPREKLIQGNVSVENEKLSPGLQSDSSQCGSCLLTRETEEGALSGTDIKGKCKPQDVKRNQLWKSSEGVQEHRVGCQ